MVGVGTVLADDPRLTVRLVDGTSPRRVVVDSRLRMPETARMLHEPGPETIIATRADVPAEQRRRFERLGCRVLAIPRDAMGRVDLACLLEMLSTEGVQRMLVEGGRQVITSMLRERLIDRLVICIAPKVLGTGIDAVGDLGIESLADAVRLDRLEVRSLGPDTIVDALVV